MTKFEKDGKCTLKEFKEVSDSILKMAMHFFCYVGWMFAYKLHLFIAFLSGRRLEPHPANREHTLQD